MSSLATAIREAGLSHEEASVFIRDAIQKLIACMGQDDCAVDRWADDGGAIHG